LKSFCPQTKSAQKPPVDLIIFSSELCPFQCNRIVTFGNEDLLYYNSSSDSFASVSLPFRLLLFVPLISCLIPSVKAAVIDLTPSSNNIAIEQLLLLVNGAPVLQTTEAGGVTSTGDNPVIVTSVRVTDGAPVDLKFFNNHGAAAVNVNPQLSTISGVGVFDGGTVITSKNQGHQAYGDAFAAASQNTNLRNFAYHDYLSPGPTNPAVADLDLLFFRALNLDDYVLMSERWGNSSFSVTALKADGTAYANANVLRLGGSGGAFGVGYQVHDWNTGYAAATNQPSQAQALTLFSVEKFFEGTNGLAGPVYGLRIHNVGEADVKVMGISNNTFADNPQNPMLVPEPSTCLIAFIGIAILASSRKR
jgi:hypothetical protein